MSHSLIDEEINSSPMAIGQLALRMHMSGRKELEMVLPDSWGGEQSIVGKGHVLSQGRLQFESTEDLNRELAAFLHARHFSSAPISHEIIFPIVHELWSREIGQADFVSGRLLVEVSKQQDIIKLATLHIQSGARCFDVLHVVEAMFVHDPEIHIESLVDLAGAQHEGTKNDICASMLYSALERWLAKNPTSARKLSEYVASIDDEVAPNLLGAAILGLSKSSPEESVFIFNKIFQKSEGMSRAIGQWICGFLLQQENISSADRINLEKFILGGFESEDASVRNNATRAASELLHLSKVFDENLERVAKAEDTSALIAIVRAMFMKTSLLAEQDRLLYWLPYLLALTPENQNSLGDLDHVLSGVFQKNIIARPRVMDFLTSWVLRHGGKKAVEEIFAQNFDQCLQKIVAVPEVFAELVTDWLFHDSRQLPGALTGILSELEVRQFRTLRFDAKKISAMSAQELMFLARRLRGFVHYPNHLLTLTLSMLNVEEIFLEKTVPVVGALIVNEIGYDYPGTTIKALETARLSESRKLVIDALDNWQDQIQAMMKTLEDLPRINELRPPKQLQRQFFMARKRQMEISQEEAAKQSIVRQLATEIQLKAGRGWFSHSRGEYSEPSQLSSFSYSAELPRREVLDPIGNAIRGLYFRIENKPQ